jgi:hypothetical protein
VAVLGSVDLMETAASSEREVQGCRAGVRLAGSSAIAAARRARVRLRHEADEWRSSLATVAGLIPALAASCSWDR